MEISGLVAPASALAIGMTGLGATTAMGKSVGSALDGLARNPGSVGVVRGTMILGLAMIDSSLVLVLVFLMSKL